jgi:hypothetical protein
MSYKALAIKIIAALGIPLFPLGARLFLSQNSAGGFQETAPAPRGVINAPPADPEGFVQPEKFAAEALPRVSPETLARVFSPPNRGAPKEQLAAADASVQTQAVPGDGKFSYLGSIRESTDQEWLYIKEKETGRVISINARAASINEEHCVVELGGISYFIRRK